MSEPSVKRYPYVVRYSGGGATFVRTSREACALYKQMREHSPRILLRTSAGELLKRRVDPATGLLHICSKRKGKR